MRKLAIGGVAICAALALTACDKAAAPARPAPDEIASTADPVLPEPVPGVTLPPVDDCADLSGFAAYRAQLKAAVDARDFAALTPMLDPAIKLDFGGGAGLSEFAARYKADARAGDEFWTELAEAMALGCANWDETSAVMPYYFAKMPDSVDSYSAMMPVRSPIALRDAGSADAKKLADLEWPILIIDTQTFDPKSPWLPVSTANGKKGFVASEDVRSALDYRALFNRIDGKWRMTAFIAGD